MTPLLPGATLGVLGGGQLGRMFVHAAQRLGYATAVLDPDADSPAGRVSHHFIPTDYLDIDGLARLAGLSAAITTEFENVPAQALERLAAARPVAPAAPAVAIAQDRIAEKAHFRRCGVVCAPYAVIATAADLDAASGALLPGILKTARLGYDGKGQRTVADRAELEAAWAALGQVACVLEKRLPLALECSVIVARGQDGQLVHYPPQRNAHRGGILAVTEAHEGNLPAALARQAIDAARSIAQGLGYVGVLCVEFFVLDNGVLVVNEMAPRPHNSGHWTQDGCDVSQFELQVRTLCGLPLTQPRQHSPSIMLNLLGDLWFAPPEAARADAGAAAGGHATAPAAAAPPVVADTPVEPPWAAVLALPGAQLHLYGKAEPRRGRKMGHLNLTGADLASVRSTARQAAGLLGLPLELSC